MSAPGAVLPETAAVHWRPRLDAERLRRRGRLWTATTVAHSIPFLVTAVVLLALEPLSFPVAIMAIVHAWMIPELYAARGANVLRPRRRSADGPERVAAGLLGDLVGHDAARGPRPHRRRARTRPARRLGRRGGGRAARPARRPARGLLVRQGRRRRSPVRRPHRPSPARPAGGRAGLRDRGEPRLQRRSLAGPPPPRPGGQAGARRGRGPRALSRPASPHARAQPTGPSATHPAAVRPDRPHVDRNGMRMGPAVHTGIGDDTASCSS